MGSVPRFLVSLVVALGSLIWFWMLLTVSPNIDYIDYETQCAPVLDADGEGGSRYVEVVRGQDVVAEYEDTGDGGRDETVRDGLEADCADRRTALSAWAHLPAVFFVFGALGVGGSTARWWRYIHEPPASPTHRPPYGPPVGPPAGPPVSR